MISKSKTKNSLLLLLVCGLLLQCRESDSGCCKDSFATNFDPMAEENTCCNYPQVNFSIFHKWLTPDSCYNLTNLDEGVLLPVQSGMDSFIVEQSAWFIREMELFDGSNWLPFEEEVEIPLLDSMFSTVLKNYAVNDFDRYRVSSIGTSELLGNLSGIRFTMGWEGALIDTTEERISRLSSLARAKSLDLIDGEGDVAQGRINFRKKSDSTFYSIAIEGEHSYVFDNLVPIVLSRGYDRRIGLKLDYSKLLKNINLDSEVSAIEQQIRDNLDNNVFEIDTIY